MQNPYTHTRARVFALAPCTCIHTTCARIRVARPCCCIRLFSGFRLANLQFASLERACSLRGSSRLQKYATPVSFARYAENSSIPPTCKDGGFRGELQLEALDVCISALSSTSSLLKKVCISLQNYSDWATGVYVHLVCVSTRQVLIN